MDDIYTVVDKNLYKLQPVTSNSFNPESGDMNGLALLPNTLVNAKVQQKSRTYDAIVDGAGNADFTTIEDAVKFTESIGGGSIFVIQGTYTPLEAMTITKSTLIEGESENLSIIDFNSTTRNFTIPGTVVSTTGTITVIAAGINVTGSGTSWLSTIAAGQHLFLGTRWYLIAAVTSDTTLVLAESYGDDLTLPVNVRVATMTRDVDFKGLQIKNSTNTGGAIDVDDCRNVTLSNLLLLSNRSGFTFTKLSEFTIDTVTIAASTSNGFEMTDSGLAKVETLSSVGSGGHGGSLNNLKTVPFNFCAASSNTTDGINATSVVNCIFKYELKSNGGQGIEFVSGCNNNEIDVLSQSNTSDGVKLTATSDANLIKGTAITDNSGYGINIAASTCDNNTILAPYLNNNTSGAVNDSGTGTIRIQQTDTVMSPVGGDGSDGAVTISADTTLTKDMYYTTLVVNSTKNLTTAGYRIFAKTSITNNGIIRNNGAAGGNGGNGGNGDGAAGRGAAGSAGAVGTGAAGATLPAGRDGIIGKAGGQGAGNTVAGENGVGGGNGVAEPRGTISTTGAAGAVGGNGGGSGSTYAPGSGGTASTGGTSTLYTSQPRDITTSSDYTIPGTTNQYGASGGSAGSGGGGGGGGSFSAAQTGGGGGGSGGSGGNGGVVYLASPTITNTGTISSLGGNGGTGGNGGNGYAGGADLTGGGGGGAGGSGGSGGTIIMIYNSLTDSGTISVTAGSAGTGGSAGSSANGGSAAQAGTNGNAGATGVIIKITA